MCEICGESLSFKKKKKSHACEIVNALLFGLKAVRLEFLNSKIWT